MKYHFRITTAKVVLAMAALMPAFAHGGFEHIRGTVAKVANNVLTVRTAKGDVNVKLDSHTQFTHNDRKAQVSDLQPGARVIAEVPEGSRDHVAHSVRIGDVPGTPSHR
jgi:hypothetical protein